jgi:thiol-disulfide isomerase/thioredoxin
MRLIYLLGFLAAIIAIIIYYIRNDDKYPKIIMVYTDWCNFCKMNLPIFNNLSNKFPNASFIRINGEGQSELDKYGITDVKKYPSFYILTRKITEMERLDENIIKDIMDNNK